MSATTNLGRQRVTFIAEESTFGVLPSSSFPNVATAFTTTHDTLDVDALAVEMLDIADERTRRDNRPQPIQGLTIGSKVSFGFNLKTLPTASQVTGSSIPTVSHRIPYRHHFGAEGVSYGTTSSGTTIAGATTITGQAGWGAHVVVGSWLAIVTSSGLEFRKVLSVSTDTVTLHAGLIGSTSNSAVIRGLFTYAPADLHTTTFTFQRAFENDSNAQYSINGCAGSMKWSLPIGKIGTVAMDAMATVFTGPSAQSLAVTAQTDDMGSPLIVQGPWYASLASAPSFSTRYPWISAEFVHSNSWVQVRDGGAVQTVSGMRNVGGNPRPAQFKVRAYYDATASTGWEALWSGQTAVSLVLYVIYGSGATEGVFGFELPNAVLVEKPKVVKEGELNYMDLMFNAAADTTIGSVSATPQKGAHADFANATVRCFWG